MFHYRYTKTSDNAETLSGIITAINGNLGFKANAFNGVGFETFGLKPANFTFYQSPDGVLEYMPRRAIVKKLGLEDESTLKNNPAYRKNQFPLLPTNEMLVLFNKGEMERIRQQKIFRIPESNYSNVK